MSVMGKLGVGSPGRPPIQVIEVNRKQGGWDSGAGIDTFTTVCEYFRYSSFLLAGNEK